MLSFILLSTNIERQKNRKGLKTKFSMSYTETNVIWFDACVYFLWNKATLSLGKKLKPFIRNKNRDSYYFKSIRKWYKYDCFVYVSASTLLSSWLVRYYFSSDFFYPFFPFFYSDSSLLCVVLCPRWDLKKENIIVQ